MKKLFFINKIIDYFQWKFGKFQFRAKFVSDNPKPEEIEDNIVYVVGGNDYVKWAYLRCPDNCGENIMLNLSENRSPSWTVKRDKKGRATVYPSIHKLEGCKSHFWIKKGRLIWT